MLERRCLLSAVPALPNIPAVTGDGVQHQPSIVADPHAPNHLALAYLDYSLTNNGYGGVGISASQDGGKTWTRTSIPLPAGFDEAASNPIAKFDDQGRLYVSFMATKFIGPKPPITNATGFDPDGLRYRTFSFKSNNGIFVARSDDGGATWHSPVAVTSHVYDGTTPVVSDINPDMAIDTIKNSPNYGYVYVV